MVHYLSASKISSCVAPAPLGMQNGLILDRQLSASSSKPTARPENGRLKFQRTPNQDGGWMSASWDNEPWFMVDFLSNVTLTAIGLDIPDEDQDNYVVNYKIDYGNDGVLFEHYVDGENKVM